MISDNYATEQDGDCTPARNYDEDLIYPVPELNVLDYNLIVTGPRGGTVINLDTVVRYLKDGYTVYEKGRFYKFDGSIYKPITEEEIKSMIHLFSDAYTDAKHLPHLVLGSRELSDVITKLKAVCTIDNIPKPSEEEQKKYKFISGEGDDFFEDIEENTYYHLIPFKNGLFNMQQQELYPFTPCVFITHKLKVRYYPEYKDTVGAGAIMEQMIPDADTRNCLYEMIGYTIYAQRITGKDASLFILYGAGGNGKGTLQNIMTKILGDNYVSNLDIPQVTAKFTSNLLDNAIVNFCSDATVKSSSETHIDSGVLKALATGEPVVVQRKNEKPYKMYNNAKLWFMANCQPDLGGVDGGILRRLHIIHMMHEFRSSDNIQRVLYTKEAIHWLARKCLDAYILFLEHESTFADSEAMVEERTYYAMTDNVFDYLNSRFNTLDRAELLDALAGYPSHDIYMEYQGYCNSAGVKEKPATQFYEVLRTHFRIDRLKDRPYNYNYFGLCKNPTFCFDSVEKVAKAKAKAAKDKAAKKIEEEEKLKEKAKAIMEAAA